MKPDMTMNENKFLTLFMGECWHEWNIVTLPPEDEEDPYYEDVYKCKICGREVNIERLLPAPKDRLSNPLPVIRWMEKEMPEVWEKYLKEIFAYKGNTGFELPAKLNKALDLSNLVNYLSEHREWGDKECPEGKIKHPALVYMEECDE